MNYWPMTLCAMRFALCRLCQWTVDRGLWTNLALRLVPCALFISSGVRSGRESYRDDGGWVESPLRAHISPLILSRLLSCLRIKSR